MQTANQRKANEKFAKLQEKKMGKPEAAAVVKPKKRTTKSKISGGWLSEFATSGKRGPES